MKKLTCFFCLFFIFISIANAMVVFDDSKNERRTRINATALNDFIPISFVEDKKYNSVLEPFIKTIADTANFDIHYMLSDELDNNSLSNKYENADIFIGCFADSYEFRNFSNIYPAAITSPVSIITLPDSKITRIAELKNFKSGFLRTEPFSDFVKKQIKDYYKAKEYNSYLDMFKALINKEIDYIFSNYYYGTVKIAEHGLGSEVVFSKQSLWDVPMFLCVNGRSANAQKIYEYFSVILKKESVQKSVKENLITMINNIKRQYRGVGAPDFINKEN